MKASEAVAKLAHYIPIHDRRKYPWLGTVARQKSLYDCAAALSWVVGKTPEIISCGVWEQHFKNAHRWYTTGIPVAGDFVIFDWKSGLGMGKNQNHDHIGIVVSANKKGVTYVSADSTKVPMPGYVTENTVSYKYVTGYGRPVYEKG
jgi:hypothetical protein